MSQAPIQVPTALQPLLVDADATSGRLDEMDLAAKLSGAITDPTNLSPEERLGAFAEIEALRFQRPLTDERGAWGIYWGPLSSMVDREGKHDHFSPDVTHVNADVLSHWIRRSEGAKNPVLRARFADLAWEIGRFLRSRAVASKQLWILDIPHTLAQRAIDASLEAVVGGYCEDEFHAWQLLDRAAELAIALNDDGRVSSVKAELFDYHRRMQSTQAKYQWWRFDDTMWDRGKGLGLTADEQQEIVQSLELALVRHTDRLNVEVFDPHNGMMAADRLARRWSRPDDLAKARAALKTAALAFEAIAKEADALLASAWLEELIPRYRTAGMPEDAARVEQAIRARAEEAQGQMKRIEVPVNIPKEQLDEWADKIVGASVEEAIRRIAANCLIREEATRDSLKNMVKDSPLVALIPHAVMGPHGFTVAKIGSVNSDLDGRTVQHAADLFNWHAPWLYMAFNRAKEKHGLDSGKVLEYLMAVPQFAPEREPLLREGLNAWSSEDSVKAIHVLVPQLEAALRDLLAALGASVMEYRSDTGGFEAIGMGKILHHEHFRAKVPVDIRFHLRALYSDARSINLRNRLAHGLVHPGLLGMGVANWVVHSLLVVGTMRVTSPQQTPQ